MPYLEIDYSLIDPGDLFVCDHTQCDFWVESQGKQLRPWFTAILDARSRCIVGWYVGESPNQDTIIASMLMAFRDWSIPRRMRIDNGRDFTSKLLTGVTKQERDRLRSEHGADWRRVLKRDASAVDCVDPRWTGIVTELDIELIYAIAYAPWSKGQIERFYGTFHDQCGKTFSTYCGNSTLSRPECLEEIRRGYSRDQKRRLRKQYGAAWKKIAVMRFVDQSSVPTMDEAREAIGDYLATYHNTKHGADDMGGRCPIDVWNSATSIRKAARDELIALMQARGVYRVQANGVKFKIGPSRIGYGGGNPCLYKHVGRDVFITLDPSDVSYCCAWTPERDHRRFIGRLECNKPISPFTPIDQLRDGLATVNRARRDVSRGSRSTAQSTRTAAQELRARRRKQAVALKATGTDDHRPNIEVVQTGFDTSSNAVRTPSESPPVDRRTRDLADAAAALAYGFGHVGKDAERENVKDDGDLLHLIAGNRHDRNE